MGIRSKFVTIVAGLIGLSSFSQVPEFTQQYMQRLGGAVQELRVVVSNFDDNAKEADLTREDALNKMVSSSENFVAKRGLSMSSTITRFTKLEVQQKNMNEASLLQKPLYLVQNPDYELIKGTWSIYKPAIPLTKEGAVYGGVGGFLAMLLAFIGIGWRRGRKKRIETFKGGQLLDNKAISKSDKVLTAQIAASASRADEEMVLDVSQPPLASVGSQEASSVHFKQQIHGEIDASGNVVRMPNYLKK